MLGVLQHLAVADHAGHDDVVQESVNLLHLVCPDHVLEVLPRRKIIGVHLRDLVIFATGMEEQVLLEDVLNLAALRRLRGVVHIPCQPHGGNEVMKPTLTTGSLTDSGSLNAWIFHDIEEPVELHVTYA